MNSNNLFYGSNRGSLNRFRSFSVNAKEQYATPTDEEIISGAFHSGSLTPAMQNPTQAEISQHNIEVQAFANQSSSSRPRALTAGLLESKGWNSGSMAALRNGAIDPRGDIDASAYRDTLGAMRALNFNTSGMNGMPSLELLQGMSDRDATPSLWLGNVPSSTAPSTLEHIFEKYGKIDSVRVLSQKGCGFVNFELAQSAVVAKLAEEGKEIFPGAGPLRIGYAKAPSSNDNAEVRDTGSQASNTFGDSHAAIGADGESAQNSIPTHPSHYRNDLVNFARELGADQREQRLVSSTIDQALQHDTYGAPIPPYSDSGQHHLMHDPSKLRDIRKRIDNNLLSQIELDSIASDMLPEIVELSFNWLGNMIVQKLFDYCSLPIKEVMLRTLAPRLAELGTHKNGTYVAQKVIEVAILPAQKNMIIDYVRPYSLPLFQDTCGNYVMQKCLPFMEPLNSIVFDPMIARPLELGCDHFGARAIRGSLESKNTAKYQARIIAAVIVYHCVQLATTQDGALLLTWYLETCDLPNKLKVLADRLTPHMVQMCTSKSAHVTIQKIINQRHEPNAREQLLKTLFFDDNDSVLREVLQEAANGAPCIQRIMATPFLDTHTRAKMMDKVRDLLLELGAQPNQGYKKLMDDVGLSTRGSRDTSHGNSPARGTSRHGRGGTNQPNMPNPMLNGSLPMMPNGVTGLGYQTPIGPNMGNNANLSPYGGMGMNGQAYAQAMGSPLTPPSRHMQYPQQLSANARQNSGMSYAPPGVTSYSSPIPQPMGMYGNMSQGNLNSPQAFSMGPSPISPQGYGMQNGYNPMGMGVGGQVMWPQFAGYPMSQQMQGSPMPGGRRGRVSRPCTLR